MKLLLLYIIFFHLCITVTGLNDQSLISAFTSVFKLQDSIETRNATILQRAFVELEKMGVRDENLTQLSDDQLATILMKAALGEYILGLQDPNDWIITVANAETGQFVRKRSFSATRFAIIETLLLICVAALVRMLWFQVK